MFRIAVIAILCILLATLVGPTVAAARRPSKSAFQQIRIGMTRDEVIAIIGAPPGDYRSDDRIDFIYSGNLALVIEAESWYCDEAAIAVQFCDGRVGHIAWYIQIDMRSKRPTLWRRFLNQLGL
jgi:hypothetical protein